MALSKEELGERLVKLRDIRGWTQQQMAKAIEVQRPTLAQYELGKANPRWDFVLRVVQALGVPWSVFTDDVVNWHDVERIMLEFRLNELYSQPYETTIDPAKHIVKSIDQIVGTTAAKVAILAGRS